MEINVDMRILSVEPVIFPETLLMKMSRMLAKTCFLSSGGSGSVFMARQGYCRSAIRAQITLVAREMKITGTLLKMCKVGRIDYYLYILNLRLRGLL